MASKRMFSLAVIDTDDFLDLSVSAQCLYFHLGMHGDDDGFVSRPKGIARAVGCVEADIDELEKAGFIIRFSSGVIVVRDWKINNTLKNDRYHPTEWQAEYQSLQTDERGKYIQTE